MEIKVKEILKVDLDLNTKFVAIKQIKERLYYLITRGIIKKSYILKIELIKKTKYSCKIYLSKKLKDPITLILIQSILGDDFRRTTITLRDYLLNPDDDKNKYNRLFDLKVYESGKFIECKKYNVTEIILKQLQKI